MRPPAACPVAVRSALLSVLAWCGLLPALAAAAGWQGAPLALRFGPEELNAAPGILAVTGDAEGWIYAANGEGVLRFDGQRWELIRLPADALARTLAVDGQRRLWVGGHDHFGRLVPDPSGHLVYEDLRDALGLRGAEREVGTVWQILVVPEGMLFRADQGLYLYAADGKHRHWPPPPGLRSLYTDGERLYARIQGLGLVRMQDGKPSLEPGGAVFADQILAGLVVQPGGRLLVGERDLYRADARGIQALGRAAWKQPEPQSPYEVLGLSDGSFVVGTLEGDLFRFDAEANLLSRASLESSALLSLYQDREGGVWVATNNGLQRLSMQFGWSFFGSQDGVRGRAYDLVWYRDALWLAGSYGLGRMSAGPDARPDTRWLDLFDLEGFGLYADGDDRLLVAHRQGLIELSDEHHARDLLRGEESIVGLLPSRFQGGKRVWAIGEQRLYLLAAEPGGWRVRAQHDLQQLSIWGLEEEQPGVLWLGDARGPPQRWRLDSDSGALRERRVMDSESGFVLEPGFGSAITRVDGQIHAASGQRLYRWDGDRWQPGPDEPYRHFERPMDVAIESAADGVYAYNEHEIWRRPSGEAAWRPLAFDVPQGSGVSAIRQGRDGKLRVATWSGLLQREVATEAPAPPALHVRLLESVLVPERDGQAEIPLPLMNEDGAPVRLPRERTLRVRYGVLSLEPGLEFRYRASVDGGAGAWTAWANDRSLMLQAGRTGLYRVDVEARARSGRPIAPLSLVFAVPSSWYQAPWVKLVAGLLASALVLVTVQGVIAWRTRRYLEANQALERRIAQRTGELEEANRKLADLATEDPLTGVLNRRALDQGLHREWVRCMDQRRALAALMIDVDHFKRYNDEHGHLEGDRVLREVAARLRTMHDPHREILARYGGEEFVLVLPGTLLEEAIQRAEAIRASFASGQWPITLSAGVAAQVPTPDTQASDLLRQADVALYRAKREGRNRVATVPD